MKRTITILMTILLVLNLCLLCGCVQEPADPNLGNNPGNSSGESSSESSSQSTSESSSETSVPPTTTTPPTTPPATGDAEMIGSLYTRGELMELSNHVWGYGPGPNRPQYNNRPEYAIAEQNKYAKYGSNFIAPDNGQIYLTFDCGYEYTATIEGEQVRVTEWILDILAEKQVKGVFFVTMDYCKKQPELVRRMIADGHAVGNHSNTHPSMPTLSIDKMVDEVMILHDYVQEHFGYTMTLFRPPEGAFSVQSLAVVQSLGYKTVHWSFAHRDWVTNDQPDPTEALNTILTKAHGGAIYLLHAVSVTNATVLSDAIDGFIQKGFTLELFQ